MNPKMKALDLVQKYYPIVNGGEAHNLVLHKAKKCAKLTVDEIFKALSEYDENTETYLKKDFPNFNSFQLQNMDSDFRYWDAVKKEIESL